MQRLPAVVERMIFGHKGFAYGTSVFAFVDNEALVIKTTSFVDASLPAGFYFFPPIAKGRHWVGIPMSDSLQELRKNWKLIEESYEFALLRDMEKSARAGSKATSNKKSQAGGKKSPLKRA